MNYQFFILCSLCFLLPIGIIATFLVLNQQSKQYESFIHSLEATHPTELVDKFGAYTTLTFTKRAFAENNIDQRTCHAIGHSIGRSIFYSYDAGVFNDIPSADLNLCGYAIPHGLGLEAVTSDSLDSMVTVCSGGDINNPTYGLTVFNHCFLGAGDQLMASSTDSVYALETCAALATNDTALTFCERGVMVRSIMILQQGGSSASEQMYFCNNQPTGRQFNCALELNGLGFGLSPSEERIDTTLETCMTEAATERISEGCIHSAAWDISDYLLSHTEPMIPPPYVLSLSNTHQKAFIHGAGTRFARFSDNGNPKDWRPFCESFSEDLNIYCAGYVESAVKKGEI